MKSFTNVLKLPGHVRILMWYFVEFFLNLFSVMFCNSVFRSICDQFSNSLLRVLTNSLTRFFGNSLSRVFFLICCHEFLVIRWRGYFAIHWRVPFCYLKKQSYIAIIIRTHIITQFPWKCNRNATKFLFCCVFCSKIKASPAPKSLFCYVYL